MKLYKLFDELQGHECNFAQTLRELYRGHLTLVNSVNLLVPNPVVSDPFKSTPSIPFVQLTQPIPDLPYEDNVDPEVTTSELHF